MSRPRPSRRAVLSSGGALLLAGQVSAQTPGFGAQDIRKVLAHRVDIQKRGTGAVVGMRDPKGRSAVAYGSTRIGGPGADARSIFPIASLTKVFTALLLSDAVQRGHMRLDDPLAKHLPAGVVVPDFGGRTITLADLATHGAGLPLRPPNLHATDPDDPYAGYTTADLYAGISAFKLTRAPGAEFEYSNFAYGLLGQALQHRLGRSYGELIRDKITGPLGMADTGLTPPAASDPRRVQGYEADGRPTPPWDFAALVETGGLFSTVTDVLTFLGLWIGPGRAALGPAARAMLTIDRPGDAKDIRMALGWRITKVGARRVVWSNGSTGGCRAFMGLCPEDRTGVVAFNNAQTATGVDDVGLRWLGVADQHIDMSVPVQHTEIALARSQLAPLAGLYWLADDDTVIIRLEGAGLVAQVGKQILPIYPESPTRFFFKAVDAQIDFTTGGLVWTQGGQTWRYARRP
ncbi:MAG: beta-lactamase family protein [Alphaproteobacteria bacterium]|nr:beta-lactamase family protein [Alphaproteobacteria bacterium]MBU1513357.1 beta-lactamase family protein [Alphaproteobacteria bacterium]MBU2096349.1 beta-lactamase family protein [Alphaproteobacteria bacterium]MBU2149959.1 beta-lactamase family protein [Alphaproteobacteria bacterium]MBU2309843.1 beta-lactamase family protein [Alphaproteobacteria bacterium]